MLSTLGIPQVLFPRDLKLSPKQNFPFPTEAYVKLWYGSTASSHRSKIGEIS